MREPAQETAKCRVWTDGISVKRSVTYGAATVRERSIRFLFISASR